MSTRDEQDEEYSIKRMRQREEIINKTKLHTSLLERL